MDVIFEEDSTSMLLTGGIKTHLTESCESKHPKIKEERREKESRGWLLQWGFRLRLC